MSRFGTTSFLILILACTPTIAQIAQWDTTSLPRSFEYLLALSTQGDVYCIGDSTLYKSTDEGSTWSAIGTFGRYAQSIALDSFGTVFLGNVALGVFRSTDGGGHWSNSLVTEGCNAMAFHPHGYLFAGLTYTGNGKVHRSTDRGDIWTWVQLPNATNSFAAECFGFGDSGDVYAGTIDGFYRSTDYGVSWMQLNSGLLGRNVRKMLIASDHSLYIHTTYSASIDGLYRSTDRGDSWQRIPTNVPYFSALSSAPDGNLYGTSDAGIFQSTDHGTTWNTIGSQLGTFQGFASMVVTRSGRILVGGYRVFRSRGVASGVEQTSSHAVSFSLMQNYPNPFNPTTTFQFTVPNAQETTLKIYDLLGREVATLVNEVTKPGVYTVQWDASRLSSGTYFYELQSGSNNSRKKLMLLK